jgi:hypothetical protein
MQSSVAVLPSSHLYCEKAHTFSINNHVLVVFWCGNVSAACGGVGSYPLLRGVVAVSVSGQSTGFVSFDYEALVPAPIIETSGAFAPVRLPSQGGIVTISGRQFSSDAEVLLTRAGLSEEVIAPTTCSDDAIQVSRICC